MSGATTNKFGFQRSSSGRSNNNIHAVNGRHARKGAFSGRFETSNRRPPENSGAKFLEMFEVSPARKSLGTRICCGKHNKVYRHPKEKRLNNMSKVQHVKYITTQTWPQYRQKHLKWLFIREDEDRREKDLELTRKQLWSELLFISKRFIFQFTTTNSWTGVLELDKPQNYWWITERLSANFFANSQHSLARNWKAISLPEKRKHGPWWWGDPHTESITIRIDLSEETESEVEQVVNTEESPREAINNNKVESATPEEEIDTTQEHVSPVKETGVQQSVVALNHDDGYITDETQEFIEEEMVVETAPKSLEKTGLDNIQTIVATIIEKEQFF